MTLNKKSILGTVLGLVTMASVAVCAAPDSGEGYKKAGDEKGEMCQRGHGKHKGMKGERGHGKHGMRGMDSAKMQERMQARMDKMKTELGLTDVQMEKLKAMQELRKAQMENRKAKMEAKKTEAEAVFSGGNFDQAKAIQLAEQSSQERLEARKQKIAAMADFFNSLTEEQKAKLQEKAKDGKGKGFFKHF